MVKKLSAVKEVCDEIERLRRLESVMEFDDEGVCDLLHDVSLNLCVIRLISTDNEVFL